MRFFFSRERKFQEDIAEAARRRLEKREESKPGPMLTETDVRPLSRKGINAGDYTGAAYVETISEDCCL